MQTAATAYAMTDGIGDGKYEWRVTARDPNSGSLGQSAWKTFKIDQTVPVLGSPKAKAFDHGSKISLVAKFSEKVKGVSTKTVKLYKDGKKTAIKAKVTFKKGKKLKIVNKGKLHLRVGSVYLVKLASGDPRSGGQPSREDDRHDHSHTQGMGWWRKRMCLASSLGDRDLARRPLARPARVGRLSAADRLPAAGAGAALPGAEPHRRADAGGLQRAHRAYGRWWR